MNFPGVQILGYSHESNFLGQNLFRYRTTKNFSIQGSLVDFANVNGISSSIYSDLEDLQDYFIGSEYVTITINGESDSGITGSGRVTSISFQGGDDVSDKTYTANVEIIADGDLSSFVSSGLVDPKYAAVKSQAVEENFKYIESISESFDYSRDQNGDFSYSQTVEVSCRQSGLATAKQIAIALKENNGITGLLGLYGSNVRKIYEEKVNKINNTYSFTENGNYSGTLDSVAEYYNKTSRSFTLGEDGNITIKEDGEIVGFGTGKFAKAKNAFSSIILPASKDACEAIFNSYSPQVADRHSLNKELQISINKNEDPAGGKLSYSIEYSNNQIYNSTFVHNYTISKTKRGRFYDVAESGSIRGTGQPADRFNNANLQLETILTASKSRLGSELQNSYLLSESQTENRFEGTINYNIKYTNDPDFNRDDKLFKVSTSISNNKSLKLKISAGILGQKEILQTLNIRSISSRQIDINITAKKTASYEKDILSEAKKIINQNKPSSVGYIDSCDIQYDPISRQFSLKLVWNFVGNNASEELK